LGNVLSLRHQRQIVRRSFPTNILILDILITASWFMVHHYHLLVLFSLMTIKEKLRQYVSSIKLTVVDNKPYLPPKYLETVRALGNSSAGTDLDSSANKASACLLGISMVSVPNTRFANSCMSITCSLLTRFGR
jgi:hypothetical protein